MARGILAGMIWGAVASAVGVGALSVLSDAPDPAMPRPAVETLSPVPEVADPTPAAPESAVATPPAPATAETPSAPETTPTEPEAAETAAPEPLPAPKVAETTAVSAEDPDSAGRRPEPDRAVDRPAAPDAGLPSQAVPGSVGAETAPPAPPAVGQSPEAPQSDTATGRPAPVMVATEAPVMPGAQAEAPGAVSPDAPPLADAAPAQPPVPPVPSVESPLVSDAAEAPTAEAATETPDEAVTETPTAEAVEPAMPTPAPDGTEDAPAIGQPAVSLVERDGAVQQNRLPRIGDTTEAPADAAPDAGMAAETPLLANAAEVSVPDGVPRLAVVLIDEGRGPLGPATLQAFPFPVSFAIDPAHPDPAGAAEAYRALGFEVLSIARPPEGATVSDVDVTLAGALAAVPQAVAVLEAPGGAGLGADRAVISQAAAYLARSGHGLVLMPRGLNTAQQFATREGVPATTLFRDFDGEGQDATAIRRTLDQAAFRARQEGGVVMLGRLRADTISALVLWGLQDREGSLALVPVSVVLREAAVE